MKCDHLDGRLYPSRMNDLSKLIFESEIRHFARPHMSDDRKARRQEEKDRAPRSRTRRKATTTALKAAVLKAALPHAAFDGFTDSVLAKAGKSAGVGQGDAGAAVSRGRPVAGRIFFRLASMRRWKRSWRRWTCPSVKIRERIATAVMTRLAVLQPHKEAARRAAALLTPAACMPALGAKLMYRTVDAMWRAAGDTSTDFNFYTKRGILAGVYGVDAGALVQRHQRGRKRRPTNFSPPASRM